MTPSTLEDVYRKALTDAAFWKELRKDTARAVEQAGFTLSPDDLRALEEAVHSDQLPIDQAGFMEGFHKNPHMRLWPGSWVGRWPFGRWS
ncbi:MAG TPA: Os1348 family NHLP clan protein [Vicinamibacteria bacterium]|nr:Os1348 family NHLP clan protein [Vicinamibacteria bacterium]